MSSESSSETMMQVFGKIVRHLSDHGLAFTLRRAVWRLHYERYERLRRRQNHGTLPRLIHFLDREFELHPSMEGLSDELRLYGVHEPIATGAYLRLLSLGDQVLDIGANIGYYPLLASKAVGERGRVLGFEPAPSVYAVLRRNIERSGRTNIEVYPWAVGNKSETTKFYESAVANWGSLVRSDQLLQKEGVPVQVRRLDDIAKDFPDFHPKVLRMDIEGGEMMVLEGAQSVLEQYRPSLFIEFHPFAIRWEAVHSTFDRLRQLGYSSGTLIQRTWDQPWMNKWMRERRCWSGSLDALIRRIEAPKDGLRHSVFSFILKRPQVDLHSLGNDGLGT